MRRHWKTVALAVAIAGGVALGVPGVAMAAPAPALVVPPPGGGGSGDGSGTDTTAPQPDPGPDPQAPDQGVAPVDPGPIAAEQAARDAAQAAQDAAEKAAALAAAQSKVHATWDARGRPAHMAVIRSGRVDIVVDGSLERQVPRTPGVVSISSLDRVLPASWLSVTDRTARVDAALMLAPGVTLDLGGDVDTVQLQGGPGPADAATVFTGSGRLRAHDVRIVGVDGAGRPLDPGPGRPYVAVSGSGSLTATDTTFDSLGVPEDGTNPGRPALGFTSGSSGSLVRTQFTGSSVGVRLGGSKNVHLEDVLLAGSTDDGLVLSGDTGTEMSGIRSENNGANGVSVGGPSTDRVITGISTTGNKQFGLAVVGQAKPQIRGVATRADHAGGLRINRCTDVLVSGFTAADQPIGVFTHVNSQRLVLENLRMTGGRRGVVMEKSTRALEVRNSTIEGARVTGFSIGGHNADIHDVVVADSRTGLRIERGAGEVTVGSLTVNGGRDGVVATGGTSSVVLNNLQINDVESAAIRTASPGARIAGGAVRGAVTGLAVEAATTISGTSIGLVDEGIHTRSTEPVSADELNVDAVSVGVNALPGSPLVVSDSHVHALESVRGDVALRGANDVSLPPMNLLGAIGVPLIALAVLLELGHVLLLRRRGVRTHRAQPPVAVAAS
jgi:hypothetical protein